MHSWVRGRYVERRQVLPTTPSPTITNFKEIGYIVNIINKRRKEKGDRVMHDRVII